METDKVRILIVEDDEDTRELYCEALQILNLEPTTVANATEALNALATQEAPTAVILDLNVPGMAANEFHAKLLEAIDPAKTKLILISGASYLNEKARELNAWKSLKKPFDLEDLLKTVQQLS